MSKYLYIYICKESTVISYPRFRNRFQFWSPIYAPRIKMYGETRWTSWKMLKYVQGMRGGWTSWTCHQTNVNQGTWCARLEALSILLHRLVYPICLEDVACMYALTYFGCGTNSQATPGLPSMHALQAAASLLPSLTIIWSIYLVYLKHVSRTVVFLT